MASTFTTDKVAESVIARTGPGRCSVFASYALTAALVVDDVIQMVKIPKGARIVNVILSSTDLDTDGTPAIILDVGDGTVTDRFIDGATIAQAGGVQHLNEPGGTGYVYTDDDTIDVKVQVAPDVGTTSGTIGLTVDYDMQF